LKYANLDTVVTFAGIAKEFKDLLVRFAADRRVPATTVLCRLEYLSGLWAFDLYRGLLWDWKAFGSQYTRLDAYPS